MSVPALVRNAGALVGAQVVTKLVNVAVAIALVRALGAAELGRYAYVLAFAFPFGALADFGLSTLAIREISREPAREGAVVATLTRATTVLATISACVMLALAAVVGHEPALLGAIALAGASSLLSALTTPALVRLTAAERLDRVSLHRIVGSVTGSLLTLAVLGYGGGLLGVMAVAAATGAGMLVLARGLAGRAPRATPRPGALRALLRQALPFGLLMLGFALYYRIDMIMLEWLAGSRETGLYAAASRFPDAVVVLAAALGGPLFPRLSSLVASRPDAARGLLEDAWRPLLALGLPICIALTVAATDLTRLLFGSGYEESATVLRVLAWGTLPLLWVNVANHALIAADRVWPLVGIYGLSTMLNVAANAVLIPRLGATGAALATLACEWLTLVFVLRLLRQAFAVSFTPGGAWRYATAGVVMAFAMTLAHGYGLVAAAAAGAAAYVGALLVLGYQGSADHLATKRLLAS